MMKQILEKPAWRRAMRNDMVARRAALSEAEHAEFSARIVRNLEDAISLPAVFAFCWPIKHEPDVRSIVARWTQQGAKAALPVVVEEGTPLAFRHWHEASQLVPDRYGIPTPADGDFLAPDLILLPLNGFDAAGYRLGYGGGYFDHTLAAMSPRPVAVGVGFEINRLESIRPEVHDQRLDWIVTDAGAFRPEVSRFRG